MNSLSFLFLLLLLVAGVSTLIVASSSSSSSRVDVFLRGEGPPPSSPNYGVKYFCIKIPYLITTQKGTLIALAEARYNSCSDFTGTDLVMKKSYDNGKTWGALEIFYSNTTLSQNISNVIGNVAPVQIAKTGRLIFPFCQNNLQVLQMHSDDDGQTWVGPFQVPQAVRPDWGWVGLGPPGSIQLMSGKLLAPGYHSYNPHSWDGTITRSHIMLNDDPNGAPSGWKIAAAAPGLDWTNENQAVELDYNHILIGARGELTERIQIESFDGGETLQFPYYNGVPQALGGCEGSMIYHRRFNTLFYSGPGNTNPERWNMTIWTSTMNVTTKKVQPWKLLKSVDPNRTAYSSLVILHDQTRVGLLYERSDLPDFIFLPTAISFEVVWP